MHMQPRSGTLSKVTKGEHSLRSPEENYHGVVQAEILRQESMALRMSYALVWLITLKHGGFVKTI